MKKATLRIVLLVIVLAALILGYYYYLSHKNDTATTDNNEETTQRVAQGVGTKDFNKDYPETPREVVKWYNRITIALLC